MHLLAEDPLSWRSCLKHLIAFLRAVLDQEEKAKEDNQEIERREQITSMRQVKEQEK